MKKMTYSEAGKLGAIKTNKLWKERYSKNLAYCKNCNQVLPYEKRRNTFCNNSCSASFNNIGICRNSNKPVSVRNKKIQLDYEYKDCIVCETEFSVCRNKKYCSTACHRIHKWNLRKIQIEQTGEESSVVCAKRYLIETRGVKCEICNITDWCGNPVPLVMDHIDGKSENNKLSNLRLVCGNCDMQLPTYKSKNKGNGRAYRRKRYADGKSF